MENELEKELQKKFFCPSKFAQEIEQLVHVNTDMNYIDAIILKYEAMELNFLKRTSRAKLPI